MIKHLHKHQVRIGNDLYKPNGQGELFLPKRYEQFNPVDEPVKKKKKVVKKDK
jgi:hypothetical protein